MSHWGSVSEELMHEDEAARRWRLLREAGRVRTAAAAVGRVAAVGGLVVAVLLVSAVLAGVLTGSLG